MNSSLGAWQKYVNAVGSVDKGVNYGLGIWGRVVANRPVITVVVSAIVALVLGGGLVRLGDLVETEGDKLWVPQDSIWIKQEEYLENRFGITDREVTFIFEDQNGGNVLTAPAIREMFSLYTTMAGISTEEDGQQKSFLDGVCWKSNTGDCRTDGILKFFSENVTEFERIAAQGNDALMEALSASVYPDGTVATPEGLFLGAERDDEGVLVSATTTLWRGVVSPEISDDLNKDWSTDVEDVLDPGPSLSTIKYFFNVPKSVDNAIAESIGGDIPLIGIAVIVICSFSAAALFVRDKVYSKVSLALLGILTVTLSIAAGFGLSLYLSIPFTSLSQILPFILLGIGVDDIFVLVRSVEEVNEQHPNLPLPDRFEKALNLGGMSITVTSVTNAAAFMFGSLTTIPAVRWFCWSAAIAIMLDWALQLTFFLGCFVLTEKRIDNQYFDCCCCCQRKSSDVANPESSIAAPKPSGLMSGNKDSGLQKALNKYLLPGILHPVGKGVILLVFIGLAVVGGVGITKLREGLPLGTLAPDGHYYRDYDDALREFSQESNVGIAARMYFRYMDQSDPNIQKKMMQAFTELLSNDYVSDLSPTKHWLAAFTEYAEAQAPANLNSDGFVRQDVFYDLLGDFLDEQPNWRDEVYLEGGAATGAIEVTSFLYFNTGNPEDKDDFDRKVITNMLDLGEDLNQNLFAAENAASNEGKVLMVASGVYKYFETTRIIFRELMYNLGFALLGIAVVGLILLIHPVAVLIMLACIALVDLALFAEMWVFDIRLNTVSVVNLVMAVGLAVDYSMHILHTFLRKQGKSRQQRVHESMLEIGAAVLLGVISTLLGVVVLAGSQSEIIRVFFQLLTGTVVFGGIVGLLFLPVVLSFIGPGASLGGSEIDVVPDVKDIESTGDNAVVTVS